MVEGACHCGAVRIGIATAPDEITDCNCSICRRLGSLWAYYRPEDVRIDGETATYAWGDRHIAFHRCPVCGCATHWTGIPADRRNRMGVNMRMFAPDAFPAARIRRFDGAGA